MDWYLTLALVLVAGGAVLLAAEFFLPTGGFLVVGAVAAFAGAVGVVFYHGSAAEGAVALIALCVGLPVAAGVMFYGWQRLSLKPGLESDTSAATVATTAEAAGWEKYRGRYGKAVTPLRPAGAVDIDGRRLDAISEGLMIEAGAYVKCVDVRVGHVVVRKVDTPKDLADLNTDDFNLT